jgi:hypothetical protein
MLPTLTRLMSSRFVIKHLFHLDVYNLILYNSKQRKNVYLFFCCVLLRAITRDREAIVP